jgi:hypothetical protein
MSMRLRVTGLLVTAALALPVAVRADTQITHKVHKAKKDQVPPPLPSGTRGPVPQVPLDSIPPIAPQISYQDGLLTIVAPNSTLGDILRGVRKHTSADIEIPPTASERVVTRLGPAPAREVMAELLNGSRFNYILLGSPENANTLVKVVLVAKTPEAPAAQADGTAPPQAAATPAEAPQAEAAEETTDDSADQAATEAEPQQPAEQPGVKTPQQMLQEMQQRQLQMQQQQQNGSPVPPGMPAPRQPQPPQEQQ